MITERLIRRLAWCSAAAIALLIILAAGLELEYQGDPGRMRQRTAATMFGVFVTAWGERDSRFGARFPSAVGGRESGGWHALRLWSIPGSVRFQSQAKRMWYQAHWLPDWADSLNMPADVADRFARRILDLIAEGNEFSLVWDDETIAISTEQGEVVETWRVPPE